MSLPLQQHFSRTHTRQGNAGLHFRVVVNMDMAFGYFAEGKVAEGKVAEGKAPPSAIWV